MILSVRADEGEKVKVLDEGANDYIVKPFGVQEFLTRVRVLLRARLGDGATAGVYDDGFLRIDLGRRQVAVAGANARLTRREFDVLKMLLAHRTGSCHRTSCCGKSGDRRTHARQKLRDDPPEPCYLLTEPGVGYRFSTENQN